MRSIIILLVFAVGLNTVAFSQKATIDLTFAAKYNEQYIALDSIIIKNLTQGGDTVLFAPDTLLSLDYITGIDNLEYPEILVAHGL